MIQSVTVTKDGTATVVFSLYLYSSAWHSIGDPLGTVARGSCPVHMPWVSALLQPRCALINIVFYLPPPHTRGNTARHVYVFPQPVRLTRLAAPLINQGE